MDNMIYRLFQKRTNKKSDDLFWNNMPWLLASLTFLTWGGNTLRTKLNLRSLSFERANLKNIAWNMHIKLMQYFLKMQVHKIINALSKKISTHCALTSPPPTFYHCSCNKNCFRQFHVVVLMCEKLRKINLCSAETLRPIK